MHSLKHLHLFIPPCTESAACAGNAFRLPIKTQTAINLRRFVLIPAWGRLSGCLIKSHYSD
ncbi:MAG: hypothetical protein J6V99_05185 [Neisseriaceae bacterium]|nr:hypothetical protein [Neisseriaceae bacterium]